MRFMLLIPYAELGDETPCVHVTFIEAASRDEAQSTAEALASNAQHLMDLTVEDWRDYEELANLDGVALLREYGIAYGNIQIWCDEDPTSFAESPFTPHDVDPWEPPAGLLERLMKK